MGSIVKSIAIAAANFTVGANPISGQIGIESDGKPRRLVGVACCGSAAAGDTAFDLYKDTQVIGTITNKATGLPTNDHIQAYDEVLGPNQKLAINVTDAASTNPVNIDFEFESMTMDEYVEYLEENGMI